MNSAAPILELRNVDVAYGKVRALHRVSFRVQLGEVVALIGANGAGTATAEHQTFGLHDDLSKFC